MASQLLAAEQHSRLASLTPERGPA
jgi:hypothetical protein